MKKETFSLALATVMALSLAGCGGSNGGSHRGRYHGSNRAAAADTSATTRQPIPPAEAAKSREAAQGRESAGGTLIVGFDQDFPPMGFMGMTVNIQDLTWNWPRKLQSVWDLNIRHSPLPGIPRTWNWSQAISTVSGTDLP